VALGINNTNRVRWLSIFLLLPIIAFINIADAAGSKLYRYVTDKGVVGIDDHVPPEFAKNGYEVLTPDGRVIQTVPRQLTGEEGARARAAEAEAKRLQEWDKNLLLRYSSVDDIAAARDRALREIDVRLSILRSNLLSVKSQIESEQTKAADLERRGVAVPAAMTTNMEMLKLEISDTEDSIAERIRDKSAVAASFQKDIDRFKALQDVVEFRRRNTGGSSDDK
jgi:hypothetical protein